MRDELAAAIAAECEPHRAALRSSVERLIDAYHAEPAAPVPALSTERDVLAYAAYRMPATAAAVASALRALAAALPAYQPLTHSDVGGGTGAALWAAAATWPSIQHAAVVERSAPMAEVGRRLATRAPAAVTRGATWEGGDILAGAVRPADLVTMAYALGEIPERRRPDVLARLTAASTGAVVVVEPGTPAGYQRVVDARDALIAAGWSIAAPCPHDLGCPMRGRDWCHFSTRVARSALHRQLKGGALAYEDEKFSYVAAVRGDVAARCGARIVRHPVTRKGLVSLRLCTATDGLQTRPVAKSSGPAYRAARDASWGDCWDPPGAGQRKRSIGPSSSCSLGSAGPSKP